MCEFDCGDTPMSSSLEEPQCLVATATTTTTTTTESSSSSSPYSCMSNRLAQSIIRSNNDALALFLAGNYHGAILLLRHALEVFETQSRPLFGGTLLVPWTLGGNVEEESSSTTTTTTTIMPSSPLVTASAGLERIQGKSLSPVLASSCPGTAYSVYNRALILSEHQDDYTLLVRFRQRTGATILYNLALVHHLLGIHLGISAALPYALSLYELSLQTIDHHDKTHLPEVQKLLLALLNNMSIIHADLFHFDLTQCCLHHLKLVLGAASTTTMAMDEDYVFFFLNALFQDKELCFAPAA